MSRRKKKALALQREREILHSTVRKDGRGEDPAMAAYLQQTGGESFAEAAEMSLVLDRLLKGDMSMLNDPHQADIVAKLRAKAAAMQDAERRYNEDKEKFIENLWAKAEKVKPVGAKLDATIAKGTQTIQDALVFARANSASKKLQFRHMIEHGPKRKVFVTGNPIMTPQGFLIEPEVINIMGVRMVLSPGEHMIPEPFAQRYENMQQNRRENQVRSAAMSDNMRADKLGLRWQEIDAEFGSITSAEDSPALNIPGVME